MSSMMSADSFCKQKAQTVSAWLTVLCLGAVVGECVYVYERPLRYRTTLTGHSSRVPSLGRECYQFRWPIRLLFLGLFQTLLFYCNFPVTL